MDPIDIDILASVKFSGRSENRAVHSIWDTCRTCRVDKSDQTSNRNREDSRRDNDRFLKGDYTSVCIEGETWGENIKNEEVRSIWSLGDQTSAISSKSVNTEMQKPEKAYKRKRRKTYKKN